MLKKSSTPHNFTTAPQSTNVGKINERLDDHTTVSASKGKLRKETIALLGKCQIDFVAEYSCNLTGLVYHVL